MATNRYFDVYLIDLNGDTLASSIDVVGLSKAKLHACGYLSDPEYQSSGISKAEVRDAESNEIIWDAFI